LTLTLTDFLDFLGRKTKNVSVRGDFISESLRVSLTKDMSRIALLLERVKTPLAQKSGSKGAQKSGPLP
jgi:hypothetical protein